MNFNSELSKISAPKRQSIVPRIEVKTFSGVKAKEKALNTILPQEVVEWGKGDIKEITEIQKETATEASEEEVGKGLEPPNFFEFLLGKGAWRISEGKPVCIIVEKTKEKLEELIKVLCRDIYRERIGGKPTPIHKKTVEDLRREWDSLVERKIIIIEEAEKGGEEDNRKLPEMLKVFFSQDMGFLILVTHEPFKLREEIEKYSENIIVVGGLPPETEKKREEILKIIRGKKFNVEAVSFGEEFEKSVRIFEDELGKCLDYGKAPWTLKQDWERLTTCSPDDNKQASDEHSAMKAFVWLYEWKKHGKREIPDLETEDRGTDVKIDDKNYEIETLFGVGDAITKLTTKIKKYDKGEKVYFVLKNLDILRNLSLFSSFRGNWRKAGYKVEFFGLDLDKEELVPLKKFIIKLLRSG